MNRILSQIGLLSIVILILYVIIKIFDYLYTKELDKIDPASDEDED